jgi:hypothetical protein
MNWAWHQDLKPVPKLVLMALADAADDQGICITTSLLNKKFGFRHDNTVQPVYTGCTFWFYPRPLRQSGKQGTVGS